MSEATLALSFGSLQAKKLELEFSVDPLFKKASADFDEGGAKGLLLNHLMIDSHGRIVFDSSDDTVDPASQETVATAALNTVQLRTFTPPETSAAEKAEISVSSLGGRIFPDLSILDELDVCPSMKNFELGDPFGSIDIPFLKASEDRNQNQDQDRNDHNSLANKSSAFFDRDNPMEFEDDVLDAFALNKDVAFGEGGEAWAHEAALESQTRVFDADLDDDEVGDKLINAGDSSYVLSMSLPQKGSEKLHENILGYFDQALQKNWASAEHWKIRKIKDGMKPAIAARTRKEKEPFLMDFSSSMNSATADIIFTQTSSISYISLPKKVWKSKTKYLLPDDKHFNSKSLLSLFLKPKARIRRMLASGRGVLGASSNHTTTLQSGEMDEAFWGNQKRNLNGKVESTESPQGEYDANFFDDALPVDEVLDDDNGLEFADARDHFSSGDERSPGSRDTGMTATFTQGMTLISALTGAFGTTLVTSNRRGRPDYVQYARVAKRVDVRRLKEEIWKKMGLEILRDQVCKIAP